MHCLQLDMHWFSKICFCVLFWRARICPKNDGQAPAGGERDSAREGYGRGRREFDLWEGPRRHLFHPAGQHTRGLPEKLELPSWASRRDDQLDSIAHEFHRNNKKCKQYNPHNKTSSALNIWPFDDVKWFGMWKQRINENNCCWF